MHTEIAAGDPQPKFSLGDVVVNPNVFQKVTRAEIDDALFRHNAGDWGALEPEDIRANERALQCGGRLCSRYLSNRSVAFWIITEADRSVTTILLPQDY